MAKGDRTHLLFEHLKKNKVERILDIGNLGDGGKIHEKLIKLISSSEVFDIDSSPQEIKGKNYINQYQGFAEEMPFQDNFFDLVYIGEVIEHTWHPKEMMLEINRVLKTNGILILDTPNIYSISRMIRYLFKGRDFTLGDKTHKIFFSFAVLETLLTDTGFKIEKITTDNKCTIKGHTFTLLSFGSFNFLGEHLLCSARKNA